MYRRVLLLSDYQDLIFCGSTCISPLRLILSQKVVLVSALMSFKYKGLSLLDDAVDIFV